MHGSQLQRLVEVMNTLRSPGGCPWDAEQTHESLLKYLLEESYEFVDAVQADNRIDMREELGDVLLQVYFHARMAEEHPTDPFSIEDIAQGIADKLIRRHPHVFAGVEVRDSQEVLENPKTVSIDGIANEGAVGQALLAVIAWANANGIDAEAALRKEAMNIAQQIGPA